MLCLDDKLLIAEQLGRTPRNAMAVAARCPAGHPSVITCYPLRREGERAVPFPTLYWLTCPRLCAQVSHLERDGAIAEIAAELGRNPVLRASLLRDHEDYIAQRWAVLSPTNRSLVAERGLLDMFQSRGIGGMTNRAAVKCLHLHLAHHLVSGNAIGRLLVSRHGIRPCGVA